MNFPKHKQTTSQKISKRERSILLVSTIIMGSFVLFVCIATSMSLAYYTIAHGVLTLAAVLVLFFGSQHRILTRTMMVLGIIGALTALLLFAAYLPYYAHYLDYMNSLK